MNSTRSTRVLLGPQRPVSNLPSAVERMALPEGPLAVISSGWQEAEGDIEDVHELVGRPVKDLRLYQRTEELFEAHPDLHEAYRERQDELIEQQRLYSMRLRHLMIAARQLMRSEGDPAMLLSEQRHAIAQLRALDRHHARSVQSIHARFDQRFSAASFAPIVEHVAAIQHVLDNTAGVVITGGNVIVLLNRLLLFGAADFLRHKPVIAWSAGAMVLANRIVLFHDRLPEGRRDPELLGPGLGIVPDYIVLPDANKRIRRNDATRLSLFCRRFVPYTCAMLDCESLLEVQGDTTVAADSVSRIKMTGAVGKVRVK